MNQPSIFNSGAFRFAVVIAAMFAIGSLVLVLVVDRSMRAYAAEAAAVGLKAETAILAGEFDEGGRRELAATIERRQRSGDEQPFRYLLLDAAGARLAGDLPTASARTGRGRLSFADDAATPSAQPDQEVLQSLGTRLSDGSLLLVATDTFDIEVLRARVVAFAGWSGAALTVLVLVGGYLVGRLFLRRLAGVNAAVGRIMAGGLSERLPSIGMSPEFDHLSTNLNLMLDRIARLMEGMRQVSTDIAHDLRTPLTRLRQQLEHLRSARSLDEYETGTDLALHQTDEILDIFRALLRIGALEAGDGQRLLTGVDLSDVLSRVGQAYLPAAEDAGHALVMDVAPDLTVTGDSALLAQLFTNLIENALAHTPAGSRIVLSLARDGDHAVAAVADNGPGVPAEARAKILTRFYRLDSSRHAPGAGLGLALVAAIATLHDAALRIEDNAPGLRVIMRFPASAVR
ncbi:HAMP domain-containing histidine kinase [Sphingosinicellaceae bacterium]|nr:HAMP domain-containing histidine kinase [Sphingosinicellaceae bacterium]